MNQNSPDLYPEVTVRQYLESLKSRQNVKADTLAPRTKLVRGEILSQAGELWRTRNQLK